MLKVLHLLPRVPLTQVAGDGRLRSVLGLAQALADEGVTSEVMVGQAADATGEVAAIGDGLTITGYPWPAALESVDDVTAPAALAAGLSAALAALLSRIGGCDLVHAHDPLFGPGLARLAQSLTGTPYITSAADGDITDSPACEQLLCANDYGGALIVTSPELGERMAALSPETTVLVLAAEPAADTTGQHSGGHSPDGGPGGGLTAVGTRGRVADRNLQRAAVRHLGIYQAVAAGRRPVPPIDPDGIIPMALPDITSTEVRAAAGALVSGKLSQGPHVGCFEQEFADWHRAPHAVAVNSAASALFAVLSCAGITGEVLVPSFTWAATANVVVAAGATPVWVDIEDDTLGMAPEAAAAAITPRTEAVLCVHFAGHPCRVAELAELSRQHGLLLVEDAAEAAGARQNGELRREFRRRLLQLLRDQEHDHRRGRHGAHRRRQPRGPDQDPARARNAPGSGVTVPLAQGGGCSWVQLPDARAPRRRGAAAARQADRDERPSARDRGLLRRGAGRPRRSRVPAPGAARVHARLSHVRGADEGRVAAR